MGTHHPVALLAHRRAVLALVAASVLWSLGGVLIKQVDWNPLGIAGVRSTIAAATMLLLLPRVRFRFSAIPLAAAICYMATMLLFVTANKLTTAANAIFLQFTAPVYIALLSGWLLKERPSRLDWWLIALMLLGAGLFFVERLTFRGLWGNVAALASGLSFAGLVLLLRRQKDGSPVESVVLGNVMTAVVCLPFAMKSSPPVGGWLPLVLLGVFQVGVAYVLYAWGIRHVRALEACLISAFEPVLNPIWVALFVGEIPQVWALTGGVLVVGAATIRGVLTARGLPRCRAG